MAHEGTAATNIASTNPSINMPAEAAAGMRALCFWCQDTNGLTIVPPSGWDAAELANANQAAPDGQTFRVFEKKVLDGTEGASQVWTAPSNNGRVLVMVFSGRHATAAVTFATPTNSTTSDGTTPRTLSISSGTAAAGDDIAVVVNTDQQSGSDVWGYSAWSSSLIERNEGNTTWMSVVAATIDAVSAGAFGTINVDITRTSGSSNTGWGALVVAIPAAAGGGSTNAPRAMRHHRNRRAA